MNKIGRGTVAFFLGSDIVDFLVRRDKLVKRLRELGAVLKATGELGCKLFKVFVTTDKRTRNQHATDLESNTHFDSPKIGKTNQVLKEPVGLCYNRDGLSLVFYSWWYCVLFSHFLLPLG